MRSKLLSVVLLAAVAFAFAPASADYTGICTDTDPDVCAGVFQAEGTYTATFVHGDVYSDAGAVGAFAGTESEGDYSGTGACFYHWDTETYGDGCVVLFGDGDSHRLVIFSGDVPACVVVDEGGPRDC